MSEYMNEAESQHERIENSYGEVAHQAYAEAMGEKWTRKKWFALQARERGAWIAASEKVRDTFARACSV